MKQKQALSTLFLIVWCCWSGFIPLTLRSVIGMLLTLIGFWYAIKKWRVSFDRFDIIVITLVFIFPLISAIQANILFSQPIYVGMLSMRGYGMLLFAYCLLKTYKGQSFFETITKYQVFIMIIDTILLYGMNVDSNDIVTILPVDENTAFVKEQTVENSLRGARLVLGGGFTSLALAYWSVRYHLHRDKSTLKWILLTFFFVAFVTKGRTQLVTCMILFLLPLSSNMSSKKFMKLCGIGILVVVILMFIPSISSRFLVINDLFGDTQTTGTGDFSGVARLSEIMIAIPYILEHPLFGIGNISYHFNDGFSNVLNGYLFVDDIGIFGMLLVGGIFYCTLYYMLINSMKNKCVYQRPEISATVKNLCFCNMLLPFMGVNPMSNPMGIVLLIYLSKTATFKSSTRLSYPSYILHA